MQAMLDAIASGIVAAEIVAVLSNNAAAGALQRARAAGIPAIHVAASSATDAAAEAQDAALTQSLQAAGAELVVTAGYMQRLGPRVMAAYRHRMLNVHPSLLPKFGGRGMYGRRVHAAVLAAGESESGATVHLVEGDYDSGPVIAQARVPVRTDDTVETLAARVKARERLLLVEVLVEYARSRSFGQEAQA